MTDTKATMKALAGVRLKVKEVRKRKAVKRWLRELLERTKWELEEAKEEKRRLFEGWGGDPRRAWGPATYDYYGWSMARGRAAFLEEHIKWLEERMKKLEAALSRRRAW